MIDRMSVLAIAPLAALLCLVLFGERIAPHQAVYFVVEHGSDPRPYEPGVVFPFGSDVLGRDLFSLVLAGAPATLKIVLLAGLARVLAGVLIAALGSWWRPTRLLAETVAELTAAFPATLVALIVLKAFVKTDTSVLVFIGALLAVGWAGPYRVIRAEIDRLAQAPFTLGAHAVGVGRWRLAWRHQLSHLAPVIAMNLSQQVVASLVLVAELGVLGIFVGPTRSINILESQTVVRVGPPMSALVTDMPEWGAMLATSRTVEALWTTRWVIFIPGLAFALTAAAVGIIGFALARRYARRDVLEDRRGASALVLIAVTVLIASSLIPERYAEARDWSTAGRKELRSSIGVAGAFEEAGLRTYVVAREISKVVRTGPATVTVENLAVAEAYPRPSDPEPNTIHVQSVLAAEAGGGVFQGPLVFAARGIVPSETAGLVRGFTQPYRGPGSPTGPHLAGLLETYPDDYAGIDVRGKVVLLVRFMGIDAREPGSATANYVDGPAVEVSIADAIRRGAAAVIFVDPMLGSYTDTERSAFPGLRASGLLNPYLSMEREFPTASVSRVPVVVLDPLAARSLVAPLDLDLSPFLRHDTRDTRWDRSPSRGLGLSARVEVPVRTDTVSVSSVVAEVPDIPDEVGRVAVWAPRNPDSVQLDAARTDVLGALARALAARKAPFIFIDFDPHSDTMAVREALKDRRIVLVIVLQELHGGVLRFESANGDLIPAFDLYAEKSAARYEITRQTAKIESFSAVAPLPGIRTVAIRADAAPGDARADAVAVIAYVAGRLALGAPELPR